MLKITLKNEESVKIGDNIFIKSVSDGRIQLVIDAPREINVNRIQKAKSEKREGLQINK